MVEGSCHCGAVKFVVETAPDDVNSCNCSICRRYGTLWGYYQKSEVRFTPAEGATDVYAWGHKHLEFHRCRVSGCITHWAPIDPTHARIGLNARLLSPEVLGIIPVRHSDGASE